MAPLSPMVEKAAQRVVQKLVEHRWFLAIFASELLLLHYLPKIIDYISRSRIAALGGFGSITSGGRQQPATQSSRRVQSRLESTTLTTTEKDLLSLVVHFDQSEEEGFRQIGGYADIIQDLQNQVIIPLKYREEVVLRKRVLPEEERRRKLRTVALPKGVILYGPPGCGKTSLARALAVETDAVFMDISAANISSKWYGESEKLVQALFSLARKLAPTVLLLDEIDAFLRQRHVSDHEATAKVKALFLSLWDGLSSTPEQTVLVVGATNRIQDLDAAVLRRLPVRLHVRLPQEDERLAILRLALKDVELDPQVELKYLARHTDGLSGSELTEVCRRAITDTVTDRYRGNLGPADGLEGLELRPIRMHDLERNRQKVFEGLGHGRSSHSSSAGSFDNGGRPFSGPLD